jgi:hypothetical protein
MHIPAGMRIWRICAGKPAAKPDEEVKSSETPNCAFVLITSVSQERTRGTSLDRQLEPAEGRRRAAGAELLTGRRNEEGISCWSVRPRKRRLLTDFFLKKKIGAARM